MSFNSRLLYAIPNGDRWLLIQDNASGHLHVRHEPNTPSGGRVSHTDLASFLKQHESPQKEALVRLIASLIYDEDAPGG